MATMASPDVDSPQTPRPVRATITTRHPPASRPHLQFCSAAQPSPGISLSCHRPPFHNVQRIVLSLDNPSERPSLVASSRTKKKPETSLQEPAGFPSVPGEIPALPYQQLHQDFRTPIMLRQPRPARLLKAPRLSVRSGRPSPLETCPQPALPPPSPDVR